MMSQHTGQHMLSAAFFQVAEMETVSARLGSESSTIDLGAPDVSDEVIHAAEDLVNGLVLEDRPVQPLYPSVDELADLGLRRPPKVSEDIRVIQVSGYDITPCGGTHCHRTGQVGPVRVTGLERYKGLTRVTFLAGARALRYLRQRDELLRDTARELGCGAPEILDVFASLRKELRDQSQALGKTRAELTGHLVKTLHDAHPPADGFTPILAIRPDDDLVSVRKLASALAGRSDVLALAAGRDPKSGDWAVTVERGDAVDLHVGNWFREKSKALGGRGGGRPERAEGRWPAAVDWDSFSVS
jgi:alanyl-tRNA synthetase